MNAFWLIPNTMRMYSNPWFEYTDLVEGVNFLLTADVIFIVCKHLEPEVKSRDGVQKSNS